MKFTKIAVFAFLGIGSVLAVAGAFGHALVNQPVPTTVSMQDPTPFCPPFCSAGSSQPATKKPKKQNTDSTKK